MSVPKTHSVYTECGKRRRALRRSVPGIAIFSVTACAPTVDVGGVYVPAWLFSAVTGLVTAYIAVWLMAKRPAIQHEIMLALVRRLRATTERLS